MDEQVTQEEQDSQKPKSMQEMLDEVMKDYVPPELPGTTIYFGGPTGHWEFTQENFEEFGELLKVLKLETGNEYTMRLTGEDRFYQWNRQMGEDGPHYGIAVSPCRYEEGDNEIWHAAYMVGGQSCELDETDPESQHHGNLKHFDSPVQAANYAEEALRSALEVASQEVKGG